MSVFERIPKELRAHPGPGWVVWRWGDVDPKTGKRKKPPYCPNDPSRHASSTKPETWGTFEQAVSLVKAGVADGIGFALQPPYVGVDLDEELPEADRGAIMLALGSYSEVSVSGTGYHVILKAHLNGGRHPQGFGVFQEGRLWYCSGEHVAGTPETIEERQAELEAVLAEYLPKSVAYAHATPAEPVDLDDQELLEKMFASKSGEKIRRLWEGDWSGYASQSDADQALCNYLAFWTDRDAARMASMFADSGLYREEGPQKPKGAGYLARTIETAIEATPAGYQPRALKPIPGSESVSESVGETASPPAREGSRDATNSRFPRVGENDKELVAVTAPSADAVELVFQSAADFAVEDEPNAEMVLGLSEDDAAFVAGGTVVMFGKGGGGKTTLVTDISCHLATGSSWQGLKVPKSSVVAVVENDGPRGRFRRKVRAKLAAWKGDDPGDNLRFLAQPWGQLKLSLEEHRAALAKYINEHKVDVLIAGPIVSLGMIGGGTPDEVAAFEAHLQSLRDRLERPLLIILLHHTNQRGQISGAWDRVPDTLMFVVNTGKGTRLTWQKARDSSTLHSVSWKLKWADGMTFELDDTPDVTEDDIEQGILSSVTATPGGSWTAVAKPVKGNAKTKAAVRDRLIAEKQLLNRGKGQAFALWLPDEVDDQQELDDEEIEESAG